MSEGKKLDLRYEEQFHVANNGDKYLQQLQIFLGDDLLCDLDSRTVSAIRDDLEENAAKAKDKIKEYAYSSALDLSKDEWAKIIDQIAERFKTYDKTL